MAAPELIIPEVDDIRLPSHVLQQLLEAGLLQEIARRTVSITGILSTQGNQVFGGGDDPEGRRLYQFSRTASAVARMCFLKAGNVFLRFWPSHSSDITGHNTGMMNEANNPNPIPLEHQFAILRNIGDEHQAARYSSRYDQLNPYPLIRHNFEEGVHQWTSRMFVFVFGADRTDIAEFVTSFNIVAGNPLNGHFNCNVQVEYTLYQVQGPHVQIEQLRPLRMLRHPGEYEIQLRPRDPNPQAVVDEPEQPSEGEQSDDDGDTEGVEQEDDSSVAALTKDLKRKAQI